MSTLASRLQDAMAYAKITRPQLIAGIRRQNVKVSAPAVSKWFSTTTELKAVHAFAAARVCRVDPEWLAMGVGTMQRHDGNPEKLPARRLALIQAYGSLPDDVRAPIRALIETLATAHSKSYREWSEREGERARKRDRELA
jgi:hypothetical protein